MPEQFLEQRFAALAAGDFAGVYDSYHEDALFRGHFPERDMYVRFAEEQLAGIKVTRWCCLDRRMPAENNMECLLVSWLEVDGEEQLFYELALLLMTEQGWKYHSAQKLGTDDYRGVPERIRFEHFDDAPEKIRF